MKTVAYEGPVTWMAGGHSYGVLSSYTTVVL